MECYRSANAEDWAKIASSLKWADKALREPRINCLETWFEESRQDLGRMRATTTLGLTHSDGYILFSDPNPLPTPDHLHDWYPFWDFKLGKPLAAGVARDDGSTGREFENGYVVYNPPGQAATVEFETPRRRVSNGRLAKTHVIEALDGDIFTKPRVLIIGDSISLGYTPFVQSSLESEATVIHNHGNAGPTIRGLENIDEWLGDEEWDVIHFNFGLWDMYGWRYAQNDLSPAAYETRLEDLVLRLKKTGASLIWATTTPVCEAAEEKSAVMIDAASEEEYLDAAGRVMTKHGIPVNDLHAFMALRRNEFALGRNDVHYSESGYRRMAQLVSGRIGRALADASAAADKN